MFWFFGRQTKECKLRWIGWRLQPLVHPKTLTLLRLPRNLPLALLRSPHQSLRCSNPSYSSRHRAAPPLKLRVPGSVGFADCAKSNPQADARFPIPSTNVGKTGGSQSGKRCLRSWNGQVGIRTGVLTWSFIVGSFPLKVFFIHHKNGDCWLGAGGMFMFFLQDLFITRVTKTIQKKNVLSKKKKRGWFTKEMMASTLNWSALLGLRLDKIGSNSCIVL